MRRLNVFLLLFILSVSLLVACEPSEGEPVEESSVETNDNADSVTVDDTEVEDTNETEEPQEDTGLEIPEEFPSDYPLLDGYIVTEALSNGPDSITGELVQVTLRYYDTDKFLEAIDLYKDFYEKNGYEIEYLVEHGEIDHGEGAFDLKATTEEKAHFCNLAKLPNDDFFTLAFSIRNK
ncbi:MAG TPA: hypothetical protein GXZ58_05555 [Bacilli bacterium]|nr:hypothetical protein [Bacilli bacterium]